MLLIVCNIMFMLTGCTNQIPEMTEAENALITEYAAGLLLKYHADYNGKLVDTSILPEPVVPDVNVEEIVSDNTASGDSGENVSSEPEEIIKPSLSIAQVLGVSGFDVTYRSFEVCDKYPETESTPEELFFSMKAGQENKLLVLKLDVMNTSAQENMFDTLMLTELDCKLIMNNGKTQRAYVSMLENDFMAISRKFDAGEVYEAVIITEMPEAEAQAITSVGLQLQLDGRETTLSASE